MNRFMLMFSLGPVQSFIAQARKTRDLWLGSFLLSTLMEAGMKDIQKEFLIFPSTPTIEGRIPDLPNKYVAIFDDLDIAQQCAKNTEDQIKACWQRICDDVWSKIIKLYAGQSLVETRIIWEQQVRPETFFEIFWAIAEGNETEYPQWLERTQKALDARKRLRNFLPQEQGEQGEKSTISGERDALRGNGKLRNEVRAFWRELAQNLRRDGMRHDISFDGEERLDAIDTVKRFAYHAGELRKKQLEAGFPSTSSIATASYVEALLRKGVDAGILEDWLSATKELEDTGSTNIPLLHDTASQSPHKREILRRDGDCYFPETFTAYRLKKDYGIAPENEADAIAQKGQRALRQLLRATDEAGIVRPTPYYAMLQMDGDRMGILLSGVKTLDEHKRISEALSQFARGLAPSPAEKQYPGRLIYAGGDDVFPLAPLARDTVHVENSQDEIRTVLDLANLLQQKYCEKVKGAVGDVERQKSVSASTGIAIAHHYTSLSYVRRMAKEAEDLAKKRYGRNALVVSILRRSGEQTRVGCHWHYKGLDDQAQPLTLFSQFYSWFKDDILSPRCIYILLEEAPTLVTLPEKAQTSEIKRILTRQRNDKQTLTDELVHDVAGCIVKLALAMDADIQNSDSKQAQLSVELHADMRRYGLVEVTGWLQVMNFLTRREQE